jgi:hypothetical protein
VVVLQFLHLLQFGLLHAGYFVDVELAASVVSVEVLLRFVVFVYLARMAHV